MPAMPPVLAASAPMPDALRNLRRVTRAICFLPDTDVCLSAYLWGNCKCRRSGGQAHAGRAHEHRGRLDQVDDVPAASPYGSCAGRTPLKSEWSDTGCSLGAEHACRHHIAT